MGSLYTNGIPHTPIPRGPLGVGALDVCTKGNDGVLFRLFFPVKLQGGKVEDFCNSWTPWFLGSDYARGAAKFGFPKLHCLLYPAYQWLVGDVKVPAIWHAIPCQTVCPVVVASHGMAGSRSVLSTIATELASHGIIVAVIEHRDGSAAASFSVNADGIRTPVFYRGYNKDQLGKRVDELYQTVEVLSEINSGNRVNILEDYESSSNFTVLGLAGLLDLNQTILLGHSYGAATVLKALEHKRNNFKAGVLLDTWMFPIRSELSTIASSLQTPLISVVTETFNIGPNGQALNIFKSAVKHSKFLSFKIRFTDHLHGNDTPWVVGPIAWWFMGGQSKVPLEQITELQNNLILSFISEFIDKRMSNIAQYKDFIQLNKHLLHEETADIIRDG